ncbi:phage tail protein [Escherichia coli]
MGKGSSKGHTPREAKDNLKSTQLLSVIDAISEGPVEGPVDGLKSVLLNSTPVLDSEGNTNISGVTVVFRAGEQEQSPPEGFESSGSETVLGTEVKYDTPITRTITSANIDRLRFTFGVQALVETTSKGDRNPSEVRLLVQIQRNGGWVTEKDITIKGKTTSQYLASVVVGNLPPRPFNIRMRRMTPDSTTDQLQNKTLWSSYTEIIDVKQCYPNTALVGVQVDSEQFGSQQVSRNYHLRGRILQVPSNYNPQTRQYSGIWDGTFKPAYSNNMAWCLWDMLTHPRYGMGKRLGAADVDKWALYVIGQNCDQSVPDGFGGTEPRITCNAWLTTQRKAWDVLSDFCSAMRCMPVWNGQTLTFVQDRPSDKVWTYNRSNVVMPDDGAPFRYSFSALKDRHNAVEVNWIDPNNGWETATELVEDTQAIVRYGRNVTKMDAFGCTSRGQAHRAGLWLIKTELLETQTVDFSVGAEGLRHVPGDVIEICDDDYAGISTGGRVLAVNSQTRTLTLDREITLPSSGTTLISLVDGSGNPVSVEVQSVTDGVKVKVSRVPDGVAGYSVWGLKLPTLRQRLFRCVSIRENDDGTYAITAVQHVPEKEAIVDNGAHFDGDQSGTVNGVTPPAVQHLTAEVTADSGEYQVLARWDTPKVVKGVSFLLRLTVTADDGSERLVSTARTTETTYRFTQLALGNYRLTVRAVNAWGQQGDPASVSFRIAAPAAPSRIELTPGYFQITAVPRLAVYDPTVQFEFWFSEKRITNTAQVEKSARYLGTGSQWTVQGSRIKPGTDFWFYVRSVNLVGKSAFVEASGQPSNDGEGYLEIFRGLIDETLLGQALKERIDASALRTEVTQLEEDIRQRMDTDIAEVTRKIGEAENSLTQLVAKKNEDQTLAIAQVSQKVDRVSSEISQTVSQGQSENARQIAQVRQYVDKKGSEITSTTDKKLGDQAVTIQQIQRVQSDTRNELNAMYMLKVQKTKNGIPYVAGIGAGIEDVDGQTLSNILLQADRIAMITPENGNTTPLFVAQGNQLFMNDVFLKRLFAVSITSSGNPPTFSLTPDGRLAARNADISGAITANTGTLNNVTINENCVIRGKLSANQIEGDLVKTVGKAFPRDSRAPKRWPSGTITVRVYDDQPFNRQIVIPAVAFSGARHERENSDTYSSCRLIVKKNGAEIYNRTAMDNTLVYSGVIDMPAGRGDMTLEFSVSAWWVNGWYPTASISDLLVVVMKKATAGITIS